LKETTDWIESHLIGLTHTSRRAIVTYRAPKKNKPAVEVDRQIVNTHESVSVVSFEGCSLTLGQLIKGDDYSVVAVNHIPLDQLTRTFLKLEQQSGRKTTEGLESSETTIQPASFTSLTIEASANAITWKRRSTGSVPMEEIAIPFEGKGKSVKIDSDDESLPPRIVNAFNHAIQLCHHNVKPEPF